MKVEHQIAIIFCGTKGLLKQVPVHEVKDFERQFIHLLETSHKPLLDELKAGNLSDETAKTLSNEALALAKTFVK